MEVSYLRPVEASEVERADIEILKCVGRVMAALPADSRDAIKVLDLAREWLGEFLKKP